MLVVPGYITVYMNLFEILGKAFIITDLISCINGCILFEIIILFSGQFFESCNICSIIRYYAVNRANTIDYKGYLIY